MHFDSIEVKGLHAVGIHGVLDDEKVNPQEFKVDLKLTLDTSFASADDELAATVNYAAVATEVVRVIEGPHVDLIETLAQRIADAVLKFDVLAVDVTVHKPSAPIPYFFEDVSVNIHRDGPLLESTMRRVVVALGSNLADPVEQLTSAIRDMARLDLHIEAISPYATSEPVLEDGQDEQPDYLNAVVILTTAMPPLTLLQELQRIENRHGRVRTQHWGPRCLDLDIIDVEGVASANPRLTLPHPRAAQRRFVLEPWHAIDPEARIANMRIADLLPTLLYQEVSLVENPRR